MLIRGAGRTRQLLRQSGNVVRPQLLRHIALPLNTGYVVPFDSELQHLLYISVSTKLRYIDALSLAAILKNCCEPSSADTENLRNCAFVYVVC